MKPIAHLLLSETVLGLPAAEAALTSALIRNMRAGSRNPSPSVPATARPGTAATEQEPEQPDGQRDDRDPPQYVQGETEAEQDEDDQRRLAMQP